MSQNTSIGDRLEFMGLDQKARETLRSLQPFLKREVGNALTLFYDKVRKTPDTRKFFRDDSQMTGAAGRSSRIGTSSPKVNSATPMSRRCERSGRSMPHRPRAALVPSAAMRW